MFKMENFMHPHPLDGLQDKLEGDLLTDPLSLHMLSTDASIFRVKPAAVAYPKCAGDVVEIVRFAGENGYSIHSRGAGSGLGGSALGRGIIIDFTKYMNRLVSLDLQAKRFECEPGFRCGELEARLKGSGLFFPPAPSSGEYATFGGMYGTNASGSHSVKYGNVSDYIVDAEVVLGSGEQIRISAVSDTPYEHLPSNLQSLHRLHTDNAASIEQDYPAVSNNVCGYNLRGLVRNQRLFLHKLLAGSEGTLGIVTRLAFRLIEKPAFNSLVVAYFDDIVASARAVQHILPLKPSGIEIMDKSLLRLAADNEPMLGEKIPAGIDNVLLIEFDAADQATCANQARQVQTLLREHQLSNRVYLAVSEVEKEQFWAIRKAAVPILYRLKGRKKVLALIEDATVPIDALVDYFNGIFSILNRHKRDFVVFGHIAKGLLHTRPLLDLKDRRDVDLLKTIADEVFDLVNSLGGSISGEHGDGRLRSAYIEKQYPLIHPLFGQVKTILDELNLLNPEIKTHHNPRQMQEQLRFGADYTSDDLPEKRLLWPEGLAAEIEKCHGCSKCTTVTTATRMCPIYKFSRDEAAAPKAKANVLRALISGAVPQQDLYKDLFQSVINRCVNCGSCARECPSNVNIPKMALEARAQYVSKFGTSPGNLTVAHVELAGRLTRKFSSLTTPLMNAPAIRRIGEQVAGIARQHELISFASRSLFERLPSRVGGGQCSVLYFAGCYAGYIRPEIGEAAVEVLEKIGLTVHIPSQHCCGLPLLSKGLAASARRKARANLAKWSSLLQKVDHVVVTCSSCGYSLMHEWGYLLPPEIVSAVQAKVIHISRLVDRHIGSLALKPVPGIAAYHQPCHLKVQPNPQSTRDLLCRVPDLSVVNLDSHCCGMAGSWGLSAKNYPLSRRIGEDLKDKCEAAQASVGLTDCPTCRIQMEHLVPIPIRHPIEIIRKCL